MTVQTVFPLGFGISVVLCLGAAPRKEPSQTTPRVYTNQDLERVHPFRDELGGSSVPAVAPVEEPEASRSARETVARRGEEYWRREAEKVRNRLRTLRDQAEALRDRIARQEVEQRRATRGGRRSPTADQGATLRARLAGIERRMRETEEDLTDRARREGALPGWLR